MFDRSPPEASEPSTPLVTIRTGEPSANPNESFTSSVSTVSNSYVTVPRIVPVNFVDSSVQGLFRRKLDCNDLNPAIDSTPIPHAIKESVNKIFRRHLRPINSLRIASRVCFLIVTICFLLEWANAPGWWFENMLPSDENWRKVFRWVKAVCFCLAIFMQLGLHYYFRSESNMRRLQRRLETVCMAAPTELNLHFRLVNYKTVDHVMNCTYSVKTCQKSLRRAYRNKADVFELFLGDSESGCRDDVCKPAKSCEECLLQDVASLLSNKVKMFVQAVEQAKQTAHDKFREQETLIHRCGLDFDMVLAIAMYTFDLEMLTSDCRDNVRSDDDWHVADSPVGAMPVGDLASPAPPVLASNEFKPEDNFFYNFNRMYREDHEDFWDRCNGYLYYLLQGLRNLDPYEGEFVYRGIDGECARAVRKRYKRGSRVSFAAFSSAAKQNDIAIDFATSEDGIVDGIVFRIRLQERNSKSRDISAFSLYQDEKEVLLLPNFVATVTSTEQEGYMHYIDLLEATD